LQYMNSTGITNFGLASLLKFRILQMLDYDRVMFLDADIIPLCRMDYMFEESYRDNGLLEDNVVISGAVAPATASLFLLTPRSGEFERIIALVHQYRRKYNGSLTFDRECGWGHKIRTRQDRWKAYDMREDGYHWDYTGANADQGLLHHWVRYLKMNYSQILTDRVQTWAEVTHHAEYRNRNDYSKNSNTNSLQRLSLWWREIRNKRRVIPVEGDETYSIRLLAKIREVNSNQLPSCTKGAARFRQRRFFRNAPWSDHLHFQGSTKPWFSDIHASDVLSKRPPDLIGKSRSGFWLYHLARANETFQLGLPSTIERAKRNPFGGGPSDQDILDPNSELPK